MCPRQLVVGIRIVDWLTKNRPAPGTSNTQSRGRVIRWSAVFVVQCFMAELRDTRANGTGDLEELEIRNDYNAGAIDGLLRDPQDSNISGHDSHVG